MTWSSSHPGTQPTVTMSSPSLGERCASTIALVRHVPPGDGVLSATAIIALTEGDGIPRSSAPQLDADTDFLTKDLCRMSLAEDKMPTGCPVAPLPGAAPPPAGSVAPIPGTMPSPTFPYGLDPVAWAYASSVSTSMSAYEELPGHHLRSTLDLVASTPAFEYLDSMETPDTELRATAFHCHNLRDA
jgi:hypothetical protein